MKARTTAPGGRRACGCGVGNGERNKAGGGWEEVLPLLALGPRLPPRLCGELPHTLPTGCNQLGDLALLGLLLRCELAELLPGKASQTGALIPGIGGGEAKG